MGRESAGFQAAQVRRAKLLDQADTEIGVDGDNLNNLRIARELTDKSVNLSVVSSYKAPSRLGHSSLPFIDSKKARNFTRLRTFRRNLKSPRHIGMEQIMYTVKVNKLWPSVCRRMR